MHTGLFNSFFVGGFECSTHRLRSGKRLDVVHSTRHDELASSDYRLLQQHGIRTARDGLRWHLIEQSPGTYDFSSATGMLRAGRDTGMQIIWDLWHYGWPDDIDIFSAAFVDRFTSFAREAAARISEYQRGAVDFAGQRDFILFVGGGRGRDFQSVCQTPRRRNEAPAGSRQHRGGGCDP